MNDTSKILVNATRDALILHRVQSGGPVDVDQAAKVATAALLRQLAVLMNTEEVAEISALSDEDWPDAGDLHLLADDVEASL